MLSSRSYNTISKYLEGKNFRMEKTLEILTTEYEEQKKNTTKPKPMKFRYICPEKHISKPIGLGSFNNKKRKFSREEISSLCVTCSDKLNYKKDMVELQAQLVLKGQDHVILEYINAHNITYKCGNCSEITERTTKNNLLRAISSFCTKCQNASNRNTYQQVKQIVEASGVKLGWSENDFEIKYRSNKQRIPLICLCGKVYHNTPFSVKRGRLCSGCKPSRTKATNMSKYGCENTFQSEVFKEKGRQTNIEKLGVPYAMQNKKIQLKAQKTCLEKYGKKWAFTQDYV